jgi:hypothetical protein
VASARCSWTRSSSAHNRVSYGSSPPTTTSALRFYQRRGYRIRKVRVGAVDAARRQLKPSIPEIGQYGIAIHDEIVLERRQVSSRIQGV